MKTCYIFLCLSLLPNLNSFAQEKNPDKYEYYIRQTAKQWKLNEYDEAVASALMARYYNDGHTTVEINLYVADAFYRQKKYAASRFVLADCRKRFSDEMNDKAITIGDGQIWWDNVDRFLNEEGFTVEYTDDVDYYSLPGLKDRYVCLENRQKFYQFIEGSSDNYVRQDCAWCSKETDYLDLLDEMAYSSCIEHSSYWSDGNWFLENFKGGRYWDKAKEVYCGQLKSRIMEVEKAASSNELQARKMNNSGSALAFCLAPVGLGAAILGLKSKTTGGAIAAGLGLSSIALGLTFGISNMDESKSLEYTARKKRKEASELRGYGKHCNLPAQF